MSKLEFYSSKKLRKKECDYYIIIGQKSNGKSFDIKSLLLKEAYEQNRQFAYMRRWTYERTANKVEQYFADEDLFKVNNFGEYNQVQAYTNKIYLGNITDKGKKSYDKLVGYAVDLSGATHYSSLAFPDVYNILFEEFITDSGYLGNDEVKIFNTMVSTVLRRRPGTHVYMIGNTINRFCPYFSEFGININDIKKGDIVYYTFDDKENNNKITVGIEYCEDIYTNKLVFGHSAKMINGGEWQTSKVPLVKRDTRADKLLFKFFVEKENSLYKCLVLNTEDNQPYIFVYPYNNRDKITTKDRFFTDKIELKPLCHNNSLTKNLVCDSLLIELFKLNRICYSDSLTGTEFEIIRKERGFY